MTKDAWAQRSGWERGSQPLVHQVGGSAQSPEKGVERTKLRYPLGLRGEGEHRDPPRPGSLF